MDILYNDLPARLTLHFTDSGYTKNNIIEIYEVEFAEVETRYLIQTKSEFIFYRHNGDPLKQLTDGEWKNYPIVIDKEILDFINANCEANTVIVDANMKSTPLQIEIYEGQYKTLCFDSPTQWLATYWKLPASETPVIVTETLLDISKGKSPDERYKIEYNLPALNVADLTNSFTSGKKIVYAFKFIRENDIIYIDEYGNEVRTVAEIPL